MVAVWFGFHQTIGAYMAGLILQERYFDLDEEVDVDGILEAGAAEVDCKPKKLNTYDHTLHTIEDAAFFWLGPFFFVNLGASIPIRADIIAQTIGYSILLYFLLGIGQFLSATISARYVPGGFTWAESAMIGFGMLGRAELFFVVLNICYVDNDILNLQQFFTFTTTALLLDITVPICITLYKPYYVRWTTPTQTDGDAVVDSESFRSTGTQVMMDWLHSKAHRQTMKNERRGFKPEVDAEGEVRRTGSKSSLRSADGEFLKSNQQVIIPSSKCNEGKVG
jgi:Kef-type K+ transport system membrane component KefB